MFLHKDQQQLIYIKSEGGVRKSRVVKTIKMRFTLLNRKKELVISTPTSSATNSIARNIVHITLGVNNSLKRNYHIKSSAQ